ncbi:MAG: D-alanine--D-alanine ligase A [Bacteroidetes bacterium 4572_77]|nr:MAG: D-alanine--D-alanine ligase A [Bacteroidetes bacterium 4572_77]
MINVALIAGGDSGEFDISIKSAQVVAKYIPTDKYNVYLVEIKGDQWVCLHDQKGRIALDKNDFSLSIDGEKIKFDVVFNAIHGTPGEDGKFLGYLEMLNIPFTSSSAVVSGLTFNKAYCNSVVKQFGFRVAQSVHLIKGQPFVEEDILKVVGLPCFVKPNQGGSSVGMSKVKLVQELIPALRKAFAEDTEVLVEEFVDGRELTIGVMNYKEKIWSFPITEIISKNEFFDFEAKYNSKLNEEITPARIQEDVAKEVSQTARHLFQVLNLKGITRFDFILSKEDLVFIEVNTVPGLTTESLVPKQVKEMGYELSQIFDFALQEALNPYVSKES